MEQISLFELFPEETHLFKTDKPIRLIELFAGVGAQAMALRNIGADFEHYKISEWDVNSVKSYRAIHMGYHNIAPYGSRDENAERLYKYGVSMDGKTPLSLEQIKNKGNKWICQTLNDFEATHNIGSITNIHGKDLGIVDTEKYAYLLTYSFPCQDLSVAGLGKGMKKGDNTRSGLLWEVERILRELAAEFEEMPQMLLMENVPQVIGQNNMEDFKEWLNFLSGIGYTNTYQILNAKNFDVPQSRQRCFMLSVHGNYNVQFPEPHETTRVMEDCLEDQVAENYYLTSQKAWELIDKLVKENKILTDRQTDRQTDN